MIIERLDLRAFGKFTDFSIDLSAAPQRFHLVYGANESGKSTSLRAITSLLFGMPHAAEDNYRHTNAQLRVGGLLTDESGNRLECVRRRGRKATLRDGNDDEVVDETIIEEMLGGINRETFLTRFGLSHAELKAGGAAVLEGQGDLGQILFAAGAGIGKLREIEAELDQSSNSLFNPRGTKAAINVAIRELDEKRSQLRQAQIPPAEYSQLGEKIQTKRAESESINEAIQSCAIELDRLRNYQHAAPKLPQWRKTIESLAEVATAPVLDDAFSERRRQALSDRDVAASRQKEIETRIAELKAKLESTPADDVVITHESEIQSVFQQVAARDKADRDRIGLIRTQKNLDRKMTDLLRQLSIEITGNDDDERFAQIEEAVERLQVSESRRARIRQLVASRDRLVGNRNDASDAIVTTKRRLAEISAELESMGTSADTATLAAAIDAVGNPQAILETFAQQQENCAQLRQRCSDFLERLAGFNGTIEQAAKLQTPTTSIIERLTRALRQTSAEVSRCEERVQTLQVQRGEIDRQIRDEEAQRTLPTLTELQNARELRDQSINRIEELARRGGDVSATIEELREIVRTTDGLADTIRAHHEKVHLRQTLAARLARIDVEIAEAETSHSTAKDDADKAWDQWVSAWEACDVVADQPERMQRWIADHEQLCEAHARFREEELRLEQARSRVERASTRLRGVLAPTRSKQPVATAESYQAGLFDDPPEMDLIAAYQSAVEMRSDRERSRREYETLCRKRDELSADLPEAETRLEAAQTAVEEWREEWQRITESFAAGDRVSGGEVLLMLDQISELCSKKRERDILTTRISSIGEDEASFADRVNRLVAATNQDIKDDLPATAIAQTLYQRLQAERAGLKSRESIAEQIEANKQRLLEIGAQRTASEVTLEQLCLEAGCDGTDALPVIEQASRRRLELQTALQNLENQLSILAGDQRLEEFIQSAGEQKAAILDVETGQKEAELQQLRDRKSVADQELGALQHELARIDGGGRASDLIQSIQFTVGKISQDVETYARTRIAALLLRRAVDHYRKENQSPVLAHANRYFSLLTCGEYRELKTDYDAKGKTALYGVHCDGSSVPGPSMSDGTADALYLALRLASLEHQMSHGKSIPMIIDDCLVQLDDRRCSAALKALSELSRKTQVILFTHHRHLIDLAAQSLADGEVHVHELESR